MYMILEGDYGLTVHLHVEFVVAYYCWTQLCFFFRVLQNIIELRPKSKYIFAVDHSKNTLEDIVKVTSLITWTSFCLII